MTKKYKLLKDLPDANCGTILTWDGSMYRYKGNTDAPHETSWYVKEVIENAPEWFSPIEEPKEEQPFQWSDELVYEFCFWQGKVKAEEIERFKEINGFPTRKQQTNTIPSAYDSKSIKEYYDSESPTQSQPKTEKIEVEFLFMFPYGKGGGAYNLSSPIKISEEKYPLIKQAIEFCLNNDVTEFKGELRAKVRGTFTQSDIDKAVRQAEEKWFNIGIGHVISGIKSYEDYKKQKP